MSTRRPPMTGPGWAVPRLALDSTVSRVGQTMAPNEFGDLFDAYADLMQERVFDPIGMANSNLHVESLVALPAAAARDLNSARKFDDRN